MLSLCRNLLYLQMDGSIKLAANVKDGARFNKLQILNIDVLSITQQELLENLNEGVLLTPNIDVLFKLQHDKTFYDIYKKAEWVVCDSRVIYFLSKLMKAPLREAIPGSSFFTAYYQYHRNDPDCKIFLLGASEGVADKARQRINGKMGRNIVVGALSPSYGFEKNDKECQEIIEVINRSAANVLLVGVGVPKQEKWIDKYRNNLPHVKLFMALGATIDFEAGNKKRAPKLIRKLGLEWFYRFLNEPQRLFKRYFIDDIQFFYYFAKQLMGTYKDPFSVNKPKRGGVERVTLHLWSCAAQPTTERRAA